MNRQHRKPFKATTTIAIAVCIVLCAVLFIINARTDRNGIDAAATTPYEGKLRHSEDSYAAYIAQYENAASPQQEIVIEAAQYNALTGNDFEILEQFAGMDGQALYTGETGKVEWSFHVPQSGLYQIELLYYPIEGKSSAIERIIAIDGKVPFEEAQFVQFDRIWNNELDEIKVDNQGNELRPRQVEYPQWMSKMVQDSNGYITEPFQFYLTEGEHTLSFEASREPMIIKEIRLKQKSSIPTYAELAAQYEQTGAKATSGHELRIEGEAAVRKSSPTLYPVSERTSAAVAPYSASLIKINTIGGFNWRLPGQWIEWEIDVPEDGLYELSFVAQQNWVRGIYSTRKLYIDGVVPFQEMNAVGFKYKSGYRLETLGQDDQPYLYYLTAGKHTLRLENTLGPFAELIAEVENSLYELNSLYRNILMITGTKPDEYRDYQLTEKIPNLLERMTAERYRLTDVAAHLKQLAGGSSDQEALLKSMTVLLDEMIAKPDNIHRKLTDYKTNTGGLGTWVQQAREHPLEIDAIILSSPGQKLDIEGLGIGSKLKHELLTFVNSFFIDYNSIGNVTEQKNQRTITVWIGSGRDQANTMKAMIDETFTSQTGINVNLKLVQMHTLLPATLAGQGPDVAMQIDNDIPVNFAMRNAAADLTQFADYGEVEQRFRDSAVVPYRYTDGVYALPEQQTFNMLFYRKDVLDELELEVPKTWDDVSAMLAVLSKNHMQFGLPPVQQAAIQGQNIPPNSLYAALLFQNGGQFYRNDGKESDLDSRVAIETFKQWTEYYTDYKLEREYDFANRFRTGEMPIGIADYTIYNQLTVFAPEIRGLWGFAPIPGTVQEDGTINNQVPSGGSAVMMLESAEDKEAAWQFMKWWTSDETQAKFGREMEGLMGAAARYPTANINALDSLPWPVADYEQLKQQFDQVVGIPEVPGGYFTGRHLFNAFYKTVIGEVEARQALMDYVEYIQDEIENKRQEFGLPQ
ncbi:ABC transporter substrate-binding protein [Paenibacillus montaniterrae]|uniref:ABC transporter substrate-binding protein n=1 Tax=Paenibacillus montaniterrae TaxID=429341 RepID=A0A919YLU9_9BACL|nr:extracellular solute-binding protein [Paenibacillus montaniterrae]GIP15855.1 ABC transporter substrate-binding protein [Paenibacillus montaniterrae]